MPGIRDSVRWEILSTDAEAERRIVSACGVSPIVARTLVARGMGDPAEVTAFLSASLERDWLDPLVIPGMSAAVDRVDAAVDAGETIAVFGDFDVDGMSATSLLTLGLTELGADVHPYIPDRFTEGYGLSRPALARMIGDCSPQLIITVDNGIAAKVEVAWLRDQGIDVVITDHHEPADLVPEGVPVADPKIERDCPSRELAGAGVALKLLQELGRRRGRPAVWRPYTELACLGTISDMMSLTGENRALVMDGVERLRNTGRPGIMALCATARVDLSQVTADSLPFSLIPRLNAAGRMGETNVAFELLYTNDPAEATTLAGRLEAINTERRAIEASLAEEAFRKVDISYQGERAIVVAGEGWHEGVKGIVASRLASRYHVPSLVFSVTGGVARGSGRSVGSVDLFKAVDLCSDVLVRFGGHAGAVGVTCEVTRLDAFRERLRQVLAQVPAEDFEDRGEVCGLVSLDEMTVEGIDSLEVLQPFGQGNKKPLFCAPSVFMRNRSKVGANGNHLRFLASDGMSSVPGIMFRTPDINRAVACDEVVDLVFEPVSETWQGHTKPKLMVHDILYRDGAVPQGVSTVDAPSAEPAATEPSRLAVPEGLSSMGTGELTDCLRHALIGGHPLLPAQRAALDRLERGGNTLCVMATGRGKSLIFQLHAAREALAHGRASIFVYPLRALVADQIFHLAGRLAPFGVGVRVLTGETPGGERSRAFAELSCGTCSIVLTTPEFLAIHAGRFARTGRVGFVVVDEAHHGGTAQRHGRDAYAQLSPVLAQLGDPTVLAVSATADDEAARELMGLLSIPEDGVIVDATSRENLHVRDMRHVRDRDLAVASVVAAGDKTIVYVNSRSGASTLARTLRKSVPDLAPHIAFYHAGMQRAQRGRIERAFRSGEISCIVSTSAFGEGVNLPDVRDVVLYHLPFGAVEFNQMSGRAGRDGEDALVHLCFCQRDVTLNESILMAAAPQRDLLRDIFVALRGLCTGDGAVLTPEQVGEAAARVRPGLRVQADEAASALAIFEELGFVRMRPEGDGRLVTLEPHPRRSCLEHSSRYLSGLAAYDEFESFKNWVLSCNQEELERRITRPIMPSFGQRL